MAVGISLSRSVGSPRPADQAPGLGLEDDGYYWFLYPYFESLAASTRQLIDLYGDAEFSGPQLAELAQTIAKARAAAAGLPDVIDVSLSCRSEPVVESIRKDVLLGLLDQFDEVIRVAGAEQRSVVCTGD